jgi:hypothetical protein
MTEFPAVGNLAMSSSIRFP